MTISLIVFQTRLGVKSFENSVPRTFLVVARRVDVRNFHIYSPYTQFPPPKLFVQSYKWMEWMNMCFNVFQTRLVVKSFEHSVPRTFLVVPRRVDVRNFRIYSPYTPFPPPRSTNKSITWMEWMMMCFFWVKRGKCCEVSKTMVLRIGLRLPQLVLIRAANVNNIKCQVIFNITIIIIMKL